jgi:maleate isomerase
MSETASSRRAIGLIVPSSNRVVERVAGRILAEHPDIDCCIVRVPYGAIVSDGPSPAYRLHPFDNAATLLADAGVDAISWNATRGATLGFDGDRELCRRIESRTGIPAVTTALATVDLLLAEPSRRIGFVTQGNETESLDILRQFRSQGVEIVDHSWLGIVDNLHAAQISGNTLLKVIRNLAAGSSLDTIVVWSTNLPGHAARLSEHTAAAFTILDSAEIGINAALGRISEQNLASPT